MQHDSLVHESTPAALAGGAACDPPTAPDLSSAGPAVSAGHSIVLEPSATYPRRLTLTQDHQFSDWWYATIELPHAMGLVYCSTWGGLPRVQAGAAGAVLRLDNAQLALAPEDVEQLRPFTAYGLVIEESVRRDSASMQETPA